MIDTICFIQFLSMPTVCFGYCFVLLAHFNQLQIRFFSYKWNIFLICQYAYARDRHNKIFRISIRLSLYKYYCMHIIIQPPSFIRRGGISFRILDILSFSINLLYMNSLIFWALLFIIALNIILDTVYGCVCMPLSMIIKAQILDFSTTVQQMISLSSWCFIHFCSRFSVMPSIHRDSYSSSYVLSYFIPYKHFIVEFQFHSGRICRLLQIVSMQF